jgi:hypothetical protein
MFFEFDVEPQLNWANKMPESQTANNQLINAIFYLLACSVPIQEMNAFHL